MAIPSRISLAKNIIAFTILTDGIPILYVNYSDSMSSIIQFYIIITLMRIGTI